MNEIKLNSGDWPKEDFNLLLKRKNFGLQIIFMRNLYAKYYLVRKPQTNNHHAIHKEGCPFLPEKINRIYLGTYSCTANAITHGEKYYKNVRSCLFCLKESLEETNRIIRYKFDYYGIIAKSKTKEEIISVLQKLHIN